MDWRWVTGTYKVGTKERPFLRSPVWVSDKDRCDDKLITSLSWFKVGEVPKGASPNLKKPSRPATSVVRF